MAISVPSPRFAGPLSAGRDWVERSRTGAAALAGHAFAPVDIAVLVYFRVAFGALMLWEVYRYFTYDWIARYYIDPPYNFPYVGFEWIKPWPGVGMHLHFYALGLLALFIILGLWYRLAATLFFLGFTYVFLLEKAHYLNHFYLISLVAFLMILIPANRAGSLDTRAGAVPRTAFAPAWTLWLLRAQLAVVYVFGGVAKINGDWLRGEPIGVWLSRRTDFPLIGRWFTDEWMVYIFAYGGLLFDLLIVPLLLWRPTRLPALVLAIGFHLTNAELFQIGVFPWFAMAATLLFFPPETPRRIAAWLAGLIGRRSFTPVAAPAPAGPHRTLATGQWLTLGLVALFIAVQVLMPLRHLLYPGNVSWTEEGHRYAWHMKLRSKSGQARFFVTDPATARTWEIEPRAYLTSRQISKMSTHPDMILTFAHYLADHLQRDGYVDVEIRAIVWASLNGRPRQLLIDPTVDLTTIDHSILPASWIVPLQTGLHDTESPALTPEHAAGVEALLDAADDSAETARRSSKSRVEAVWTASRASAGTASGSRSPADH